ncbi:MAG: HAD domain-containing protein [bacterium]
MASDKYDFTYFRGSEPAFDKVIYFDIDGVLNSDRYFSANPDVVEEQLKGVEDPGGIDQPADLIDPEAITQLNRVVKNLEPTVVLTSTWRRHYSLREIDQFLAERGFQGTLDAGIREGPQISPEKNELILWSEQEVDPESFLVLDNRELLGIDNQVLIDSATGLTDSDTEDILLHFNANTCNS